MFRETYKAANDDIKASDELLDKVLNRKPKKRPPIYKYSSIAAAAVVVCVGLASIPKLNGIQNDVQNDAGVDENPQQALSTAAPQRTAKGIDQNTAEDKGNIADTKSGQETYNAEKPSAVSQNDSVLSDRQFETASREVTVKPKAEVNAKADNTKIKSDITAQIEVIPQKEAVLKSMSAKKQAVTVDDAADISERNTYTRYVVLHANSADYGLEESASANVYNAYDSGYGYTIAEWTMDDYFDYLGENVFEKVSLPSDFNYVGEYNMTVSVDENGKPGFDSQIFPYQGDDSRYVTVITSKNTATADSYIEDERYQKSDVCGTDAVVIGQEEEYKSYIVNNDVSHIVTSNGMTEEELGDLLVSIGGKDE